MMGWVYVKCQVGLTLLVGNRSWQDGALGPNPSQGQGPCLGAASLLVESVSWQEGLDLFPGYTHHPGRKEAARTITHLLV